MKAAVIHSFNSTGRQRFRRMDRDSVAVLTFNRLTGSQCLVTPA